MNEVVLYKYIIRTLMFVQMTVLMDTNSVPLKLKPYLPLYLELILESPILRDGGEWGGLFLIWSYFRFASLWILSRFGIWSWLKLCLITKNFLFKVGSIRNFAMFEIGPVRISAIFGNWPCGYESFHELKLCLIWNLSYLK